jgi:hypothetical protein
MARIRHGDASVGGNAENHAGSEAAEGPGDASAVHGCENGSGADGGFSGGLKGADKQRHRQSRRHTLSADIANGHQRTLLGQQNDLEEVAAHFSGRLVDRLDLVTRNGRNLRRHKDTLHGARGFEF